MKLLRCRAMSADSGAAPTIGDIDVASLHALLNDAGNVAEDVQLVDVREEMEERIASLPGFKLMPLSRCPQIFFLPFSFYCAVLHSS